MKLFKKPFNETKLGNFLNDTAVGKGVSSLAIGAISGVPFIGKGIADELKSNKADLLTGKGNHNYLRLIAFTVVVLLSVGRIVWPEHINTELIETIYGYYVKFL